MRRYSIFQAIPLSFFSRDLYRDVARGWRGAGIMYTVVTLALLTLVLLVQMQMSLNHWVRGPAQEYADQVPGIVIRHRVVEVDRPMPYAIKDGAGKEWVVVDTTGQVTSLEGRDAKVLLTADRLIFSKSTAETRTFKLSGVDNLRINSARVKRWLGLLSVWASPFLAPFMFGGMFLFRMVQVVAFALVGMVTATLSRMTFDFSALMRLTAVALTPGFLLEILIKIIGVRMPGWGFLWTLIAMGYVVWAVLANRPGPEDAATAAPAAPPATS